MPRLLAIVLAILAAAPLAACDDSGSASGGSSAAAGPPTAGPAPSEQAYVDDVDARCAAFRTKWALSELAVSSRAEAERWVADNVAATQALADEVRALPAPESLQPKVTAWLDALELSASHDRGVGAFPTDAQTAELYIVRSAALEKAADAGLDACAVTMVDTPLTDARYDDWMTVACGAYTNAVGTISAGAQTASLEVFAHDMAMVTDAFRRDLETMTPPAGRRRAVKEAIRTYTVLDPVLEGIRSEAAAGRQEELQGALLALGELEPLLQKTERSLGCP